MLEFGILLYRLRFSFSFNSNSKTIIVEVFKYRSSLFYSIARQKEEEEEKMLNEFYVIMSIELNWSTNESFF